ncbi:MAG: GTP-binding protein [Rhodospirillaceae bacterium]
MRIITLAGPPSVGKTAVVGHAIKALLAAGGKPAAVKFDTRSASDADRLKRDFGIPTLSGLSGYLCPDHYFVSNMEEAMDWGRHHGADTLFIETAGLCLRCAPHIEDIPAVTVVDCLGGFDVPAKMGPMLSCADLVVVTKGDLVSQAEREVFVHGLPKAAPRAEIVPVNGLTGTGVRALLRWLARRPDREAAATARLRHDMPASICSYCTGERRIGRVYQTGNVQKLDWRAER